MWIVIQAYINRKTRLIFIFIVVFLDQFFDRLFILGVLILFATR